ncbi:MAG: RagB/SusD family nutrient uptake outer membrane protein [Mucilaginibacter sp.]|nr:RagB/SusD family nutrient uptake outer membrane protein [Mucilaginibacter sp.]
MESAINKIRPVLIYKGSYNPKLILNSLKLIFSLSGVLFCICFLGSCKKLVEIDSPTNTITATETFSNHKNTEAAMSGIYYSMSSPNSNYLTGAISFYCGSGADELIPYDVNGNQNVVSNIFPNTITNDDGTVLNYFWTPAYNFIYQSNALIEGVAASGGLSQSDKAAFTGEAKFIRALNFFYLVNFFGDIPYPTSTNYKINAVLKRTSKDIVYTNIIADLQDAENLLSDDYSTGNGDRIRANKWAAAALLARVYLYKGDYLNAEKQSSLVIGNTSLFSLNPDLNKVFLSVKLGNNEAILQWLPNTTQAPYNGTTEGVYTIPDFGGLPGYNISNQLLGAFETGDQRKVAWIGSTTVSSTTYYYPYKFKIGVTSAVVNTPPTEYPTVLRLAEQYLIRAEAEANNAGSGLSGAISDLNIIRNRAGLPNLPATLDKTQVLAAVMQERRIELFDEWGHRWLDLKRTGQIDDVMSKATPLKNFGSTWQSYQQLYPIPYSELHYDPNLTENPGYSF